MPIAILLFVIAGVKSGLAQVPVGAAEPPQLNQPTQNAGSATPPPASNAKPIDDEYYMPTPHTEFGDFSDPEEERATSQFYQYGRFFGISVGTGFHGVEGNRGALWRGGFPMLAARLHYWFDFQFGLMLEFDTANHFYEPASGTRVDINMTQVGISFKYYFDVRRAAAAVAFSNPYLLLGAGSYKKTEVNLSTSLTSTLTTVGAGLGAGLEFPIVYKKTYFNIEGRAFFVPFADRLDTPIGTTIADQQGIFYQALMSLMFTW